jgi:hypothetical protein
MAIIAKTIGREPAFVKVPASLGLVCGRILGLFLRDVLLTRNELKGLMDEMLTSEQAPNGMTNFQIGWKRTNQRLEARIHQKSHGTSGGQPPNHAPAE